MKNKKNQLLFVGFNRFYMNRTFSVIIKAIQSEFDLKLYGPGFSDQSELHMGLNNFLDKGDPYQIIIFDSYILEFENIIKRDKPFIGDHIKFQKEDFYKYGSEMQKSVFNYQGKKVFISNFDTYSVSSKVLEKLESKNTFILDWSISRFTLNEKRDYFGLLIKENFDGFWGGMGNDNWYKFITGNKTRVLEVPHAITKEQGIFIPFGLRKYKFSVPGASYQERKDHYDLLIYRQRLKMLFYKIIDKIYYTRNDFLTLKKLKSAFRRYDQGISESIFSFVSGGYFLCPVRKYFEVPILGSIPIGYECEGFKDLGFKNKKNFLSVKNAKQTREIIDSFNPDKYQKIVSNAIELIHSKHSEQARSKQLKDSFKNIINGSFKGSYWSNGAYIHN